MEEQKGFWTAWKGLKPGERCIIYAEGRSLTIKADHPLTARDMALSVGANPIVVWRPEPKVAG